jgi:hypothetical protein
MLEQPRQSAPASTSLTTTATFGTVSRISLAVPITMRL